MQCKIINIVDTKIPHQVYECGIFALRIKSKLDKLLIAKYLNLFLKRFRTSVQSMMQIPSQVKEEKDGLLAWTKSLGWSEKKIANKRVL